MFKRIMTETVDADVGKFADDIGGGIVRKSGGTVNGNCCGGAGTCYSRQCLS